MTEDRIFEKMARAMAIADGKNPDDRAPLVDISGWHEEGPTWLNYFKAARRQYAAHKAMVEAMGDEA